MITPWSVLMMAGGSLATSPSIPAAAETSLATTSTSPLSTYATSTPNVQLTVVPSEIGSSITSASIPSINPAISAGTTNTTATPDLTKIFGQNNTPTVDHVANSQDAANDSQKGLAVFKAAATVLLALVKCQAQGEWIKSMFQITNSQHLIDQGGNFTRVILLGKNTSATSWVPWSKELDRDNLPMVAAKGFERDLQADGPDFDNPWWPWALTEGALEAGWAPTDTEYHWDELLHILTGEEVELKDTEALDPVIIWKDYLSKADYTPILIEWNGYWSVVMSPSVRDGVSWLGWADPYGRHARKYDDNNEQDGRLTIFTKYDTFAKITKVMHLKDFASFDGRPSILGGS